MVPDTMLRNLFIKDFEGMMNRCFSLIKKDKVIKIVGFVAFLCLGFRLFCNITYLFRNTGYDREHMVGIKSESDIDMIYIGGSAAFVYWQPLKAWTDCGFTSYSLATDTIQVENIKAYMKEAEKHQDPNLYVIGVRAFQYYSDEPVEAGVRNGADSMDITSGARYDLLNSYFKNRTIDENTDIPSYYFDIAKYHTNTGSLASRAAWSYIHNEGVSPYKGWLWIDSYAYLGKPDGFQTEERAVLPENAAKVLEDLLAYCNRLDKDVLFVVCPYAITKEDYAKYNTIKDAVEESGFRFLNANDYYDEMDIDFSTDFYNGAHVNLFGAKKYTAFLEKYICDTYEMPDHRDDVKFTSWDEHAARFYEEEKEHSEIVTNLRLDYEKSVEIVDKMKNTENLSEWDAYAFDDRFTLLIAGGGFQEWPDNIPDQKVLAKWGITEESKDFIRVISNSAVGYTNAEDGTLSYTPAKGMIYTISLENNEIEIFKEKIPISENKATVVVIDNARQKVVEKVAVECDADGNAKVIEQ